MKKLGFVLIALILMGQGCFSRAPENTAPTNGDAGVSQTMPAPGFEDMDEMIVADENDSPMEEEDANLAADDSDAMIDEGESTMNDGEDASDVLRINIESGNFFFAPDTITANAGQTIELTVTENSGFHTFVINEIGLKESIKTGKTITFTAPETPGTYSYYCDIGSHRALGMEGSLIVK